MKQTAFLLILLSIAIQPLSRWIHSIAVQQQHYTISSEQVVKDRSTVFCGSTKAVFQKMQEEEDQKQQNTRIQLSTEYPVYSEDFNATFFLIVRNSTLLLTVPQQFSPQEISRSFFHPPSC